MVAGDGAVWRRRAGRGAGAALLTLGAVLVAGLIAESGLRMFPILAPPAVRISSPPLRRDAPSGPWIDHPLKATVPDPYLGMRLQPDFEGHYRAPAPYESFPVRLVRLDGVEMGVRRDRPIPPTVFGVAVGDSFVFGWGLPADEAWVTLLERELDRPVVNLGVPGYSSIQATRMLERHGVGLRPRLVLWGFSQNDFVDNVQFARWEAAGRPRALAEWLREEVVAGGGAGPRAWAGVRNWLRLHSVTYELVRTTVRGWQHREVRYRAGALDFIFQSPEADVAPTPPGEEGARLAREALERAAMLLRRAGAELVVVVFPGREEVYWPVLTRLFPRSARGDPHWRTVRVVEFAREIGVPVIDLTPVLVERAAAGEQLYFRLDRHLNARGNTLVAATVLASLRAAGLLGGRAVREKATRGRAGDAS